MAISTRIAWHRTIRTKLIAVIILITSIVLGVTGYFAYKYIEQQEQAELAELAEVSATRLSQHLVIPMWNLDREQVSELLAAEMQELRVAAIVIRDKGMKRVRSSNLLAVLPEITSVSIAKF